MLKSVNFGEYNSFEDLNLILTDSSISTPSVKTNYVDIDGANGSMDFTEAFGEIYYENRTLEFEFTYTGSAFTYADKYSELQNLLHGQKMKIVISDDEDFYYTGRVSLNEWKSSKAIRKITIECNCEPYKHQETLRTYQIGTGEQTIMFDNLREKIYAEIVATKAVSITCNNQHFTLTPNVAYSGLYLLSGNNELIITGGACEISIYAIRGSL